MGHTCDRNRFFRKSLRLAVSISLLLFAYQYSLAEKVLLFDDYTYEPNIKTPLLYPNSEARGAQIHPPVAELRQSGTLLLEFDELGNRIDNYFVKIIHCNKDWTPSYLSGVQYLFDYNEFRIADREVSFGTLVPYIHYRFQVPPVKISGNYLLVVYRDMNETDIILSKRYIVFQNLTTITTEITFSNSVSSRRTHQQVDFKIFYPSLRMINPLKTASVVIRQNFRWDNAIYNILPVFVREDMTSLDYSGYYNNENAFPGGNEFRFFDLTSLQFNKMNVAKISRSNEKSEVWLGHDQSRGTDAYSTIDDINGYFVTEKYESGNTQIEPDYAFVNFILDSPQALDGKVYVIGAMNNWRLSEEYQMQYHPEYKTYHCRALLKQGYYNYRYVFVSNQDQKRDEIFFEGSHNSTENQYDVILYYRAPGNMYDEIVGYIASDYLRR